MMLWDEDYMSRDDFLGQLCIAVADVAAADGQTLPPTWYPLQKRSDKSRVQGDIFVGLSLYGKSDTEPSSPAGSLNGSSRRSSETLSGLLASSDDTATTVNGIPTSGELMRTDSTASSDASTDSNHGRAVLPSRPSLRHRIAASLTHTGSMPVVHSPRTAVVTTHLASMPHLRGAGMPGSPTAAMLASPLLVGCSCCFSGAKAPHHMPIACLMSPYVKVVLISIPSISWPQSGIAERAAAGDSLNSCSDGAQEELPLEWFSEPRKDASAGPMPPPLPGGIVLDQMFDASVQVPPLSLVYIEAMELNEVMWKPGSAFRDEMTAASKLSQAEFSPWRRLPDGTIQRSHSYMVPASSLVKAYKATETQTYRRADQAGYLVDVSVSTPDVPYGSTFRTEMQFLLEPSSLHPQQSHLRVSWRANFLQSTMMKGMIEGGMRSGIRDTYILYLKTLSPKYVKPAGSGDRALVKEELKPMSNLEVAMEFFGHPWVGVSLAVSLLILVHLLGSRPKVRQGIEFYSLDLPDSVGELFWSVIFALAGERLIWRVNKFVRTRILQRGDHGLKANGEGWLVTVTLLEGQSLAAAGLTGISDPYITFTCNGKSRTSSVKLQTLNPTWNEILEFDAMDDAPSTLSLEVFDYEGPFAQAESLGRAEVNFLKLSAEALGDLWLPLEGRRAKAAGSKIHLRLFLTNTRDGESLQPLMQRVEKEVGTKASVPIVKRSAQKNLSFQRLFSVPDSEFLINDYSCSVKKKLPLQGRLFISPRQLGFYSNLFGHKVKFAVMWEDIDEIKENAVSINSFNRMINPSITLYIRKGRGGDSRVGAYGSDAQGRLKLRFMSFVRPGPAFRTIVVLWKNRTLPLDQQIQKVAEAEVREGEGHIQESQQKQADDEGAFLGVDPAEMVEAAHLDVPITVAQFLSLMDTKQLDQKVAEHMGHLNYTATDWERTGEELKMQREVKYQYSRKVCSFGTRVTIMQQKSRTAEKTNCMLEELITLHDVPFGDHFQVETRKELRQKSEKPALSELRVLVGVSWHKNTLFQKKISANVIEYHKQHVKDVVDIFVKEVLSHTQGALTQSDVKLSGN
eukprot:SM000081S22658  [mRNA]  locus=s81:346260:352232:- [translate_table: standard]